MSRHLDGFALVVDGVSYRVIAFDSEPALPVALTDAERELVAKLIEGWSSRAIAAHRGTAVRTVANQLRALYQKLGVRSRHELIAKAVGD